MRFERTPIEGAYIVDLEPVEDERGMFARTWCPEEMREAGLDPRLAACNVSFNRSAGTLRGMHYQVAPHEEAKLVRCTAGAMFDVIVDLRPDSTTFCSWFGVELSAGNRRALYVPPGCAHGFQTHEDGTEVMYLISTAYVPQSARGVRWDDPAFAITWPMTDRRTISARDAGYADFSMEALVAG